MGDAAKGCYESPGLSEQHLRHRKGKKIQEYMDGALTYWYSNGSDEQYNHIMRSDTKKIGCSFKRNDRVYIACVYDQLVAYLLDNSAS
ncbi:hypothetical protein Y032_0010g1072 [Ancylostoma ceylanicum]|uniref:SCP domain-containing protein n=1 Tax=Ancylostoma ceylanicum TaxID=53326 RepID=A0A016VGY4_9BILA|nr:hypothetical protein Y032_0010g1072 [Ancylostoma ceylanicum]